MNRGRGHHTKTKKGRFIFKVQDDKEQRKIKEDITQNRILGKEKDRKG